MVQILPLLPSGANVETTSLESNSINMYNNYFRSWRCFIREWYWTITVWLSDNVLDVYHFPKDLY